MKKSLIALLLVVALVVTVSVFAASAETTNPFEDQIGEVKAYCRACESEQTWYPVNKAEFEAGTAIASWATVTQNEAASHFYFPEGMKMGAAQTLTAGKYCFDLNGKTITRSASKTFVLKGADLETAPELNLFDSSVGETGTLHVTTATSYCFRLEGSGILNIYGGNYICAGIKDANGAKPASGSSQTGVGVYATPDAKGEVNLYGGTLTGRSRMSGGLMYAAGPVVFTVDGAELEGWTGGSTGGVIRLNHADAKLIMKSGSITGHAEKQHPDDKNAVTDPKNAMSSTVKLQNYADFEMTGGTITGESKQGGVLYMSSGTAKISGGELNGTAYDKGGAIYKSGGTLTISGGKISGTATKGGGAICNTANTLTISGGEITGSSGSGFSGGNLRITGGNTNISGGKIYDGSATKSNGGNIYWSSTGKLSISGGEITGGSATRDTDENEYGRGGNIHFTAGTFEMTGGKVSGGEAYEGGNLSYISGNTVSITVGEITGGEITGGKASNYGGNIYSNLSIMTIDAAEGKSVTISGGTAKAGGNLYIAGGTTATITGPNVTITKGSDGNKYGAGSATEHVGSQITIVGDAPTYEEDGTTLKTPANISAVSIKDVAVTYRATTNMVHTTQLTLMDYAELEIDGDEKIDCVYFAGNMTGKVTVKEGFTGSLVTRWRDNNINKSFKQPGAVVPANLWQETGYVGGGDVYVVDNERSQMLTVDMGDAVEATAETEADNMFRVATVYGYKYDAEGNATSKLLGHMPTAEEGYDFVRPYYYGTYTLAGDTTFDIPERNCKIITNGFNLKLIDRSTNEFDYEEGYVTVDDETKVSIKTQLANGNQYLVLADKAEGEATKFTAHRVKVDIDSVNIKPATAGLYYTTNMDTTLEASQAAVSYGVVLSLVDMAGADFIADDSNADGLVDNLYTEIDFEKNEEERMSIQGANSALLVGILNQGAPEGQNNEWGTKPIYANAFICFNIDGKNVYFMADKTYELSLMDIMVLVDGNEELASHPSVVKMYGTWQDPLAQWGLTNIEAAYKAAQA